jgi:environmental stress-induced protein Ves
MAILIPLHVMPVPWKNGAGTTRELAVAHAGDGQVLWRISVAELTVPAGFSFLPGLDRTFMALGPLELAIGGERIWLEKGQQARFAGEEDVALRALPSPTSALNVMTRRGRCTADVTLHPAADSPIGASVLPPYVGSAFHIIDLDDCVAEVHITPDPPT